MSRLTPAEIDIVNLLSTAWNAFVALPAEHPTDQAEFCHLIHRCQDAVLARAGRRELNGQTGETANG